MTITVDSTPEDLAEACFGLAKRAGAKSWSLAWDCPHRPMPDSEEATHRCEAMTWTAVATFNGARRFESGPTPHEAALALAVRLMSGADCRCGRKVTLGEQAGSKRCRWRLEGAEWIPGCDADPVTAAKRGDYDAMVAAFAGGNRAQRRAAKHRKRRNRHGY